LQKPPKLEMEGMVGEREGSKGGDCVYIYCKAYQTDLITIIWCVCTYTRHIWCTYTRSEGLPVRWPKFQTSKSLASIERGCIECELRR